MQVFENVLDMVGRTPLFEVGKLDTGTCRLFLKLELMNPGGSIKDRIGISMIEEAEKRGDISPGDTIVEATAGNTGIGLALAAQQKGYKLTLVIPDKMSQEKIFNLRSMGAEIVLTRSGRRQGTSRVLPGSRSANRGWTRAHISSISFANPDNPLAHEQTTAPEIWEQMDEDLDAVVVGVGSSGTVSGLSAYFRRIGANVEIVLADPVGSVLADYVATGELGEKGSWLVEGIGEDFIPSICDMSAITSAYSISDAESFATARELLRVEGLLAGSSSGNADCGGAALLPGADDAETRRDLCL